MLTNIRSYTEHPDVMLLFTDMCKILESVAHFTHLWKYRNFVFATEVTIFSDHNRLVHLRKCAPKSAKLTRWALGLQEFMHADSTIFHTSVCCYKLGE